MAQNRTNTSNAKRETTPPKLFAYHVAERGEKSYWTRIGAAWEHKDGRPRPSRGISFCVVMYFSKVIELYGST